MTHFERFLTAIFRKKARTVLPAMLPVALVALALPFTALPAASDEVILVEQDDLDAYWTIARAQPPFYPPSAEEKGLAGCAAIGFIIESDGSTSSPRLMGAFPDEQFAVPAAAALEKWRFEPGVKNPNRQPVFATQIVMFVLESTDPETEDRLGVQCEEAAAEGLRELSGGA